MKYVDAMQVKKRMHKRLITNYAAKGLFFLSTIFGLVILAILLYRVVTQGIGWINMDFITGKLSTMPDRAGIMGAILGTFWLMVVVGPVTMFLGVATAIYLELYAKQGRLLSFIQTNISNLA
ncbi:MAG TPA: phosphate ABC transporter, permease protein PstA, partial [Virgibacillus sp.]|nr:phosphate ABC transporter, permease protein PstA [Virgibacillus sp.]